MTFAAAVTAVTNVIASIDADAYTNGVDYVNNAVPSTTHIKDVSKWPKVALAAGGHEFEELGTMIALYSRTELDGTQTSAVPEADRMDVETAVIVAVARTAFTRLYNLRPTSVSAAESVIRAAGDTAVVVHKEHEDAVAAAITKWAEPAARYMGLAFYNAISVENSGHNHLPTKTKRLWTTTCQLLRLKEFLDAKAGRESFVVHDTFHPLSDTVKSELSRSPKSKKVLSNLRLGNLAKRIPVKAADTGIAINYPSLAAKAFGYAHTAEELPADMAAPTALTTAIDAYVNAADDTAAAAAVAVLQTHSAALEEPSAYLCGFILGRDARASDNQDLTIDEAKGTNTILGSPAYKRAAGEYPGTFTEAKLRGWNRLSKFASIAATDGMAPRLCGVVASLGGAGALASLATARAVTARTTHRTAMADAAANAKAKAEASTP